MYSIVVLELVVPSAQWQVLAAGIRGSSLPGQSRFLKGLCGDAMDEALDLPCYGPNP